MGVDGGAEWGTLDSDRRQLDPKTLKPQPGNARYMTAAQMDQLVDNIRRDGKLTSTVLCWQNGKGEVEILSGHHRVEAAIRAEFATVDCEVITTPLTDQRKAAILLSHNAISGQDDPAKLAQIYAGLDLSAKAYSGLDDTVLNALKDVALTGLSIGVQYQEMKFFFLPEDAEAVAGGLAEIDKAAKKDMARIVAYRDFDDFFALAVRAKTKFGAYNSALAMRMLIDLATSKLDEMEAADDGQA